MSDVLTHDLRDRAEAALAEARHRRLAFAALPVGVGDPPWELLLCLCIDGQVDARSDVPAMALSTHLPELAVRRHLAVLCEAGLAWVELDPHTGVALTAGLTSDGRLRVANVLAGFPE